ncbi:MAG: hypothetical protein ACOYK8_01405 [Alphaproteobacteria bacterium]
MLILQLGGLLSFPLYKRKSLILMMGDYGAGKTRVIQRLLSFLGHEAAALMDNGQGFLGAGSDMGAAIDHLHINNQCFSGDINRLLPLLSHKDNITRLVVELHPARPLAGVVNDVLDGKLGDYRLDRVVGVVCLSDLLLLINQQREAAMLSRDSLKLCSDILLVHDQDPHAEYLQKAIDVLAKNCPRARISSFHLSQDYTVVKGLKWASALLNAPPFSPEHCGLDARIYLAKSRAEAKQYRLLHEAKQHQVHGVRQLPFSTAEYARLLELLKLARAGGLVRAKGEIILEGGVVHSLYITARRSHEQTILGKACDSIVSMVFDGDARHHINRLWDLWWPNGLESSEYKLLHEKQRLRASA